MTATIIADGGGHHTKASASGMRFRKKRPRYSALLLNNAISTRGEVRR